MVFNATFNNISVKLWRSILLVEETEVPGENHQPVVSHQQTLSYNVISSTPHHHLRIKKFTKVFIISRKIPQHNGEKIPKLLVF